MNNDEKIITEAIQVANRLRNLECGERGFACNMMWDDVFGPTVIKAAELLEALVELHKAPTRPDTNWEWVGHMR